MVWVPGDADDLPDAVQDGEFGDLVVEKQGQGAQQRHYPANGTTYSEPNESIFEGAFDASFLPQGPIILVSSVERERILALAAATA